MNNKIELHGDPEHEGISLAVVGAFMLLVLIFGLISAWAMSLWLGGAMAQYSIVSCFVGLIIAMVGIIFLDPLIKQWLPSGVVLTLEDEGITLERPTEEEPLKLTHPLAEPPLYWRRELSGRGHTTRERQIPKGWYCYACQIQNEEDKIVVHAYVPHNRVKEVDDGAAFRPLDLKELHESGKGGSQMAHWRNYGTLPNIPSSLIVGDNGRYWLGERLRWERGIELQIEDFKQVLQHLSD